MISQKITQLIRSAGEAVKTLTALNQDSASNRREAYTNAANTYFKKLEEVDLSSKQQLKTLKDAQIIPKGTKKGDRKVDAAKPTSDDRADVMDIGWLNTRSQKVGRDMEAEIWEKARVFLEGADQSAPMRLPETWSSIPGGRPLEDSDRKKLAELEAAHAKAQR